MNNLFRLMYGALDFDFKSVAELAGFATVMCDMEHDEVTRIARELKSGDEHTVLAAGGGIYTFSKI